MRTISPRPSSPTSSPIPSVRPISPTTCSSVRQRGRSATGRRPPATPSPCSVRDRPEAVRPRPVRPGRPAFDPQRRVPGPLGRARRRVPPGGHQADAPPARGRPDPRLRDARGARRPGPVGAHLLRRARLTVRGGVARPRALERDADQAVGSSSRLSKTAALACSPPDPRAPTVALGALWMLALGTPRIRSVSRSSALWQTPATRFAASLGVFERKGRLEPTRRFELRTCCLRSRSAWALWHQRGMPSVGRSVSRSSFCCLRA